MLFVNLASGTYSLIQALPFSSLRARGILGSWGLVHFTNMVSL